VLDYGCGYGGKAIAYAAQAQHVSGIEPVERHIAGARAFALAAGCGNVDFQVCGEHVIPYEDGSFDVVLSHDVLEHVDDPSRSMREIHRVLRPGGKAYLIFPPYDGAMSHHLDYMTRLPVLHWLFSARTLVSAVNTIIEERGKEAFGVEPQPAPKKSWCGRRKTLPGLNGLTLPQFKRLAADGFATEYLNLTIAGQARLNFVRSLVFDCIVGPAIRLGMREHFCTSVSAILTKA